MADPFNAVATAIFIVAIVHTLAAARLHFPGDVEIVFALWAVVLLAAMTAFKGWEAAAGYVTGSVSYTEPLFVLVIMAIAGTRPIMGVAESTLGGIARAAGGTPVAWWATILIAGPLLGSFITEPAAMTICALLLARRFYDLQPGARLKYATLGLLFVNVSIGGVLTHFAAPPVVMVARAWGWDTPFMLSHFGWRAALAIVVSTAGYFVLFRRELRALDPRPPVAAKEGPVPAWLTVVHIGFLVWTVGTAHRPWLFLAGFLLFLAIARATAFQQGPVLLRPAILVGVFLAGLVIHGGLQGWWIAPLLGSLSRTPLFLGSTVLTAFNDNALITYLAALVPNLDPSLRLAVMGGAVTGGGLTIIANAPNPAGHALLARFFDGGVSPFGLFAGAIGPTLVAVVAFHVL